MEKNLEDLGFKGELVSFEKKNYSVWGYNSDVTRRYFLEDSLNLLKDNPAFLEKASFIRALFIKSPLYGITSSHLDPYYLNPKIYINVFKHSKKFMVESSLHFPLKGKNLIPFINEYLSGNIFLEEVGSAFPHRFALDIENLGSVNYFSGFFEDSLLFLGLGNLDLNPQENIEKLKKYYRGLK